MSFIICEDCKKAWRYACPECCNHSADYHRDTFQHHVYITGFDEDGKLRVPNYIREVLGW